MLSGEKLKRTRRANGIPLDQAADTLGVTLQQLSDWENDRAVPNEDQLTEMAALYHISADDLTTIETPTHNAPTHSAPAPVMQSTTSNFIWIAVILQAALLNFCVYSTAQGLPVLPLVLFVLATLWMLGNQFSQHNHHQRACNIRTEVIYCILQLIIAAFSFITHMHAIGSALMVVLCLIYLLLINPTYMGRDFVGTSHTPRH